MGTFEDFFIKWLGIVHGKKMGCLLVAFKVFHYKFGQCIWDKTMVLFAIRPKVMIVKFMALESLGGWGMFSSFLNLFEQFKRFQMHFVMFYTWSLDA